jgi:phenylacetate-CoA ligase
MTTTTVEQTAWERFRAQLQREVLSSLAEHQQRLTWSREQIDATRRIGLRRLLAHAVRHSRFHARRLAGIDLDAIEPDDLSALPVMTKREMMGSLDDVFTDPRLNRELVDGALAATTTEPVPILDAYTAFATGGSSGERGLFVFDLPGRTGFILSLMRALTARLEALGGPPPGGLPVAMVGAASAVHPTAAAAAETERAELPLRVTLVPVTLPLAEIVRRLNELRLPALFGYPSILVRLAAERRAGRLKISPRMISSTSETLTPEARSAIGEAFGAPIVNTFATTEGLVGTSAPDDGVLTFNSDLCIAELVDEHGRAVEPGIASGKVLLTNLYNLAQPLIRYELCDAFVRRPDAAEHGHMRACVEGRAGEVLRYRTVEVHAHVVRSELVRTAGVIDYQVRQTPSGIDVDVIAPDGAEEDLADRIGDALAGAGLRAPQVKLRIVDELERDPQSGKLRRLVQLPETGPV